MQVTNEKHPLLVQYTIRSKQDYIFKTNKILEIAGASAHIRDAWEYLFECAKKLEIHVQRSNQGEYKHTSVIEAFNAGNLNVVELFCGGGNETLIFDDKSTFVRLNRVFSKYILENCHGMVPMVVSTPVEGDYKKDYQKLMEAAEIEKNKMNASLDCFILPFSMMDRDTSTPLTHKEGEIRYSEERDSKRKKGVEERDNEIKYLDNMVTKRGEESLLAVVHADGNNMGSKIMNMLRDKSTYDDCVMLMRRFTVDTAKAFGECGIKAIEEAKCELLSTGIKPDKLAYRVLIKDGDDMTFICNARYVLKYVEAYLKAVEEYNSEWKYSSCAGICIFHSHYPVAKAYKLAEQACDDSAKAKVHKVDENGNVMAIEESWIDFHYVHSGIGGNLDGIRRKQNTLDCMARPWIIGENGSSVFELSKLYELNKILRGKDKKTSRSYIKSIGNSYEESLETGLRELRRMYDHESQDVKESIAKLFNKEEDQLKAFYDYAELFDLMFGEVK